MDQSWLPLNHFLFLLFLHLLLLLLRFKRPVWWTVVPQSMMSSLLHNISGSCWWVDYHHSWCYSSPPPPPPPPPPLLTRPHVPLMASWGYMKQLMSWTSLSGLFRSVNTYLFLFILLLLNLFELCFIHFFPLLLRLSSVVSLVLVAYHGILRGRDILHLQPWLDYVTSLL